MLHKSAMEGKEETSQDAKKTLKTVDAGFIQPIKVKRKENVEKVIYI